MSSIRFLPYIPSPGTNNGCKSKRFTAVIYFMPSPDATIQQSETPEWMPLIIMRNLMPFTYARLSAVLDYAVGLGPLHEFGDISESK